MVRMPCGIEVERKDGKIRLSRRVDKVPTKTYQKYSLSITFAAAFAVVWTVDLSDPVQIAVSPFATLAVWWVCMFILAVEDGGWE